MKEFVKKGYEIVVTGPDRTDVEKIEALGTRFIEIPMNKNGTSITGDLKYCKDLIRLFRKEKPDVTLGYTVKPVVYGAISAKLAGVKNINSLITGGGYTFIATSLKAKVLGIIVRMLYRIGLQRADHVIFQNPDDLKEFVRSRLVKRNKCSFVHGSGVNLEQFQPVPFPKKISFFCLSRLLKSKGVCEFLKAARVVKERYPEVDFYLLGKYETDMQDAVEKEYVEQFIKDGIIIRFEETDDVRPYYERSSIFVLPSYREGTPRTVLEAMAMGRPIITTDTQGCRETVKDVKNGFLVPVKDSRAVDEKMMWFVEHPDEIEMMGKESTILVKKKFDVRKVNRRMMKIMGV